MLEPVLYIGITQSIFAGVVMATKRPQFLANRYMAAWLLFIGLEMILALINVRWFEMIPYQLPFLVIPMIYGPLLFLYVRALIIEKPRFHPLELLHFLPFLLLLGIAFFFRDPENMADPTPFSHEYPSWFARSMYNIIIFSSITVYSVLVYILLTKHRLAIKEQFSYATGKITLKWLLFVSITVYVSFCLTFMSIGINLFVTDVPFEPKLFTYVGLTLFSFAFSFYGYRQVSIYHPKEAVVPNLEVEKSLPKYERSRIEPNDLETIMHRLQLSMQEEKLYLNSELELKDVALHLKVPKHHITQALNSLTAKNFYTFINEFRVQEFIERMKDPDNASFTILSIALDCGFNSKSTFNSVFKRNTGRTPSEFIKKLKT